MSKSDPFEMIAKRNQVLIESLTKSLSPAIEAAKSFSTIQFKNLNFSYEQVFDPLFKTSELANAIFKSNSNLLESINRLTTSINNFDHLKTTISLSDSVYKNSDIFKYQTVVTEILNDSVVSSKEFSDYLTDNIPDYVGYGRPEKKLSQAYVITPTPSTKKYRLSKKSALKFTVHFIKYSLSIFCIAIPFYSPIDPLLTAILVGILEGFISDSASYFNNLIEEKYPD